MTEHEVPSPVERVRDAIEARRAAAIARHPGAPAGATDRDAVCDGWGLVPVLASDGSGYEPAACLGCALCSVVRPATPASRSRAMRMMLADVHDEGPM